MRCFCFALISFSTVLMISSSGLAQTGNQVTYISAEDDSLTISSVAVATVFDNVNGVYARPLEKFLKELVSTDKNWSLAVLTDEVEAPILEKKTANRATRPKNKVAAKAVSARKNNFSEIEPEVYEDDPAQVQAALANCACKALLVSRISKGPNGLNARITLFTGASGLPLIQETFSDFKLFEIPQLREQFAQMYSEMKRKLPYRGLLRSRRGNDITFDLGAKNGITVGSEIALAQILKVNRHPKKNFMVSVEKEIVGKIRVTKVEEYLSFGTIEFEKEPGVVRVGAKVLPQDYISYPSPIVTPDGEISDLAARKDRNISFGSKPKEWLPVNPPQYGRIGLLAGLSTYSQSSSLSSGTTANGSSPLAPSLRVQGEFWFSPNWIIEGGLSQSVFQISNSLSGSDPSSVDMSISKYSLAVGYNFLLLEDFFGPKVQIFAGYDSTAYNAGATNPTAFTKMAYSSLNLKFAGSFDVSELIPLQLGAYFKFFLSPSLSESPVSSGSSSNKLNDFGFFGLYKMSQNYNIRGEVNFTYFTSDFGGGSSRSPNATSTSHKENALAAGIEYLF